VPHALSHCTDWTAARNYDGLMRCTCKFCTRRALRRKNRYVNMPSRTSTIAVLMQSKFSGAAAIAGAHDFHEQAVENGDDQCRQSRGARRLIDIGRDADIQFRHFRD
jgi:hypothetical protein